MGRDGLSVGVLPFCPCMRNGEDTEGEAFAKLTTPIGWDIGEFDVLTTEEIYVAVAGHRRVCQLQPDLVARTA